MDGPAGRLVMLLSLLGLSSYAMVSCKSAGSQGAPMVGQRGGADLLPCPNGLIPESHPQVSVTCDSFAGDSGTVCGIPNHTVDFSTTCGSSVLVCFDSDRIFDETSRSITLQPDGGITTLRFASNSSGRHTMWLGIGEGVTAEGDCTALPPPPPPCPPGTQCDETTTGSLDVSTSTGGKEEERDH
jgi:hypothetical protein